MSIFKRPAAMALVLIAVLALAASVTANPKNRIDFWQNNFGELKPSDDPLAGRAHRIFERVLYAAGRRPGVMPRLFIIDTRSDLVPLAFAIPDGTVIISGKVLSVCYQDPTRGDDRLAFLLGHEIAHQLKDDFWHQRFFQAVTLSKSNNPEDRDVLEQVRTAAQMTDKILAKEIQADEHGIIYAAMAGFDTRAIITEDEKVNFFEYVAAAMDPSTIEGVHKDATHPSPKQRANTVKARLKQVIEKTDLYDLGLLFYQAGDYEKAELFFSEFLRFFPSREVYHNLATCHHQQALKHYYAWKKEDDRVPFQLGLAIDPATRAGRIHLRQSGSAEKLYRRQMDQAMQYYKAAIDQDPTYPLALNNLACAMIINDDIYKAIGLLKDALKLDPESSRTLNNLGVAFYLAENTTKALEYLTAANRTDPAFGAPLFNLGKIARFQQKQADAERYWRAYLQIDGHSAYAKTIRNVLALADTAKPEPAGTPAGKGPRLEIGDYEDDVPPAWGRPVRSKAYPLEEAPFALNVYANGYMTISQDDEIIIITTLSTCKGVTPKGIGLGDSEEKVAAMYGQPSAQIPLSSGNGWVYPAKGIAFVVQNRKVTAWTLF